MSGEPRAVLIAAGVSVATCEHGSVFLRLHGPHGQIFAAVIMPADRVADLEAELASARQAVAAGLAGECAGHG